MTRPTLLYLSLDGAEPSLLRQWMADGNMPHLAALCGKAYWGDAVSALGFGDGVLWTSMNTGLSPGNHGRAFNWHLKSGTYALYRYCEDRDLTARNLWERLSGEGRSCAVIDMVRAKLSPDFNGIQIADWLTHDPIYAPRSSPAPLIGEVLEKYGSDPLAPFLKKIRNERPDPESFLTTALARIETKTRFIEDLMAQQRHDAVFVSYSDAHDIGHELWHLHDPLHPDHDRAHVARLGDPMAIVYRALDAAIGRLLQRLPSDAAVMVVAGPGIQPGHSGRHVLPLVLDRLQFGKPKGLAAGKELAKNVYRSAVPEKLRRIIRNSRTPHETDVKVHNEWAQRDCIVLPHAEAISLLRVNLEGREPQGRIPRADFDRYRSALTRDLMELVDADSGRKVVRRVIDIVTEHPGVKTAELPDLAVEWNTDHPIRSVYSPRIGTIRGGFWSVRTGDHNNACFFMVSAHGVTPREAPAPASYLDVAATLPHLLGVDLPGLDGRPLALT